MAHITPPTVNEVRAELDRLLEDATFRRAPSHSRLLRYLVERKAAGDDGALCEAGIAMAVFQRDPATYDAEIDPIVRVSVGRLRDRLARHYQRFERVPDTVIELPKGRYAPEFRHRTEAALASKPRGLAVMLTRNLTGEARFDGLAQGLSDRLSEALVLMGLPRVLSPASTQSAQSTVESPVEIARLLGVSEVIETTLSLEAGQRLRASARLIKTADEELAWAEVRTVSPDGPYAGVDALFDAVLARFAAGPGVAASSVATLRKPSLPAAARSKVDAARMLITHLSLPAIDEARALLAEVTAEHADADAWALRARSCVRRLNFGDVSAGPLIAELQECVRRAMAIDPDNIEARALHALVSHWDARLADAEAQFRDVLRSAPNHTGARLGFAWLLAAQGRFDEALTELDAAASFDPMSLNVLLNRAWILAFMRRHDEARHLFTTAIRGGGESLFALTASADNELWAGNLDQARSIYLRVRKLAPGNDNAEYGQAWIAALQGDRRPARARQRAARKADRAPRHFLDAVLNSYLRDRDTTIASLREAVEAKESARILLGINCAFEWLADDPDFVALLGSIGLQGWCGARR